MKTNVLIMGLMTLCVISCNKTANGGEDPAPAKAESLDITATSVYGWNKADKVSIFDGTSNNLFRSQGAGETATLSGEAIKADVLYGLFPYDKTATLADGIIKASIPVEQSVSTGVVPEISVARTTDASTMNFENIAGYLSVFVEEDVTGLSAIKISSTAGETLAGSVEISFDGHAAVKATSTSSQVSVTAFEGSFAGGKTYTAAVLPGTYSEGFTIFYTVNGETYETSTSDELILDKGDIRVIANISRPLTANEKLVVGDWQVSKWGSRAYDDPTGQYCWISSDKGYSLPECIVDDVISFTADGAVKIDLGQDGKTWNAAAESAVSVELTGEETWSLTENGETLTLNLSGNAFPLYLANWDGLTTPYNVFRLSATEMVLEYDVPANEGYAQIYLQPKGMKDSKHTFTQGDWSLNAEVNEEMDTHEGPATTAEGFKWYLDPTMGSELFIWKSWGGLQIGAGWSTNTDLHVESMRLHTADIPGTIKSISVTCSYNDETNAKQAEVYAKVGGVNFGTRKSMVNEMTTFTFNDSISASGEIEIIWESKDTGISYFLRSVEVIYQE